MSSPSSIFSFDTWKGRRPRPGAAVALALGLLLLFDVAVARREALWKRTPVVRFRDEVETRVIGPAKTPSILLFGSSQTRDSVAPRPLERALGLPEGSVLNLGIPFGTPYDALVLYRRNRARLSRARLLILGLDECAFDRNHPFQAHAPYEAGLKDRLDYLDDPRALLGWAWRTYDFGEAARWAAEGFFRSVAHREKRTPFAFAGDGRFHPVRATSEPGPDTLDPEAQAKADYGRFAYSPKRARVLKDLIALARADGLKVLILRSTARDRYVDWVEAGYPEARRLYRAALLSFQSPDRGVQVRPSDRGSDRGLKGSDFWDSIHLTASGALRFTESLAGDLRGEYPGLFLQE